MPLRVWGPAFLGHSVGLLYSCLFFGGCGVEAIVGYEETTSHSMGF